MNYLVDANVLSEPTKPAPNFAVVDWLKSNEILLRVNPVILGELNVGILALPAGRKRRQLENWIKTVTDTVECLPWEAATSLHWAKLVVDLRKKGEAMPLLDGMIAATAIEHNLTIATRNMRDFVRSGVTVIDPFA